MADPKPWEMNWGGSTVAPDPRRYAEAQAEADRRAAQDRRAADDQNMQRKRFQDEQAAWTATHNPDGTEKSHEVPPPGDQTKTGPEYLSTLPPALAGQVKALSEGRRAFPTGAALRSPQVQLLVAAATQYDPTLDAANAATRVKTRVDATSGKMAQNRTAIETAIGHMGTLRTTADAMENRSSPVWNSIANLAEYQTGDPRTGNFNMARQAVVSELERVFRQSGGSEKDIQAWKESLNPNASPDQFHGAIGIGADLLKSRIDALGSQYSQGMGRSVDGMTLLNPHAAATFDAIHSGAPLPQAGGNTPPPPLMGGATPPPPPGGAPPGGAPPQTPWNQPPPMAAPVAATGATRDVPDTQLSADLDAMVRHGLPYEDVNAYALAHNGSPIDPHAYAASVAYAKINPNYRGSFVNAHHTEQQSTLNRFAASPGMAAAMGADNALFGGFNDEMTGAGAALTGGDYTQSRDAFDAKKKMLAAANPGADMAGNIVGGVGATMLGSAALSRFAPGAMAKAAALLGKGAPAAGDAVYGAAYGAGENNQDRMAGGALGAAAGVGGGMVGRGVTRGVANVIAPPAGAMAPAYAQGVFPTIGQRFANSGFAGKAINTTEQALQSFPGLGAFVARARKIPRDAFQRGGFDDALGEIAQQLPPGTGPGSDAQSFASKAFGNAYDTARGGMQFKPDQQYMGDLNQFKQTIGNGSLNDQQAQQVGKFIDNTVGSRLRTTGGTLPGDAYQKAGTELGDQAAAWGKDGTTQPMAQALNNYQTIFDNAARRNSDPAAVQMLDQADTGYAKLVRLQNAAARGGVKKDAGTFSPVDLLGAVKQEAGGVRSGAYNRGDALMQSYAEAGRGLIDTLPNSGSAERLMTGQAVAGGAGTMLGGAGAIASNPGVLGAFAPYLPLVNKLVTRAIAPRDATLPPDLAAALEAFAAQVKNRAGTVGQITAPAAVGWQLGQ